MTLDLAAIDHDLDALGAGLDVASYLARSNGAAPTGLEQVDAALAELANGVHVAAPPRPARAARAVAPARPAPPVSPITAAVLEAVAEPVAPLVAEPVAPPAEQALSPESLFAEEASTSLHVDMAAAEELPVAAAVEPLAPLTEDALFGSESPFAEQATNDLGGLDFDDPGQRVSVPDDLAAMLEGELDPNEFGPPRSSQVFAPPVEQIIFEASPRRAPDGSDAQEGEGIDVAVDGELEMFVDDEEMFEAAADGDLAGGEPLPSSDTSPSIPPSASMPPGEGGPESQPPEGGEKKGFFKKLFGK